VRRLFSSSVNVRWLETIEWGRELKILEYRCRYLVFAVRFEERRTLYHVLVMSDGKHNMASCLAA